MPSSDVNVTIVYRREWKKIMDQCILLEFDTNENDVIHKGHHIQ